MNRSRNRSSATRAKNPIQNQNIASADHAGWDRAWQGRQVDSDGGSGQGREQLLGLFGRAPETELAEHHDGVAKHVLAVGELTGLGLVTAEREQRHAVLVLVADALEDLDRLAERDRRGLLALRIRRVAVHRCRQHVAERQVGLGLLLAQPGLLRDGERALRELLRLRHVTLLLLERGEMAAALALEPAILDVLDDLERVLE